MTLNELTVNMEGTDRNTLLEDWEWLIGRDKLPILLTASGNAFLQDGRDGIIHFLDVGENRLMSVAQSTPEFEIMLADPDFVSECFGAPLVKDVRARGLLLKSLQIYSFTIPLTLGGKYSAQNIEIADVEVHFSIQGQIARQVNDLPEGATIGRLEIVGRKTKPRWKFWSRSKR